MAFLEGILSLLTALLPLVEVYLDALHVRRHGVVLETCHGGLVVQLVSDRIEDKL